MKPAKLYLSVLCQKVYSLKTQPLSATSIFIPYPVVFQSPCLETCGFPLGEGEQEPAIITGFRSICRQILQGAVQVQQCSLAWAAQRFNTSRRLSLLPAEPKPLLELNEADTLSPSLPPSLALCLFLPHSLSLKLFGEGSLEVKLPTIWADEKQRLEESEKRREEKRREEKRREEKEKTKKRESLRRKTAQVREKVGKSRNTRAKASDAGPSGQMRGEKLHAVVARSAFPSQNVQDTPGSDHFWKLRCGKSVRGCDAKQISKSKCTKQTRAGPLLEVEMSKKCTPLWRKAHFQVKMLKAPHARTTFEGSEMVLCSRRKGFCTLPKVSKTWGFCSISKNDGKPGTFEEDLERCMSRGRRSTRERC